MKVTFAGPFKQEDLVALGQTLRAIERQRPDEMFMMLVDEPDATLAEAAERVVNFFPPIDGYRTVRLSNGAYRMVCGLVQPSAIIEAEEVQGSDDEWAEIRSVFPFMEYQQDAE